MADGLRSASNALNLKTEAAKERVLGDKAVGGVDNDDDHVPNVVGGLKTAINNPNTTVQGKNQAQAKLDAIT